LTYCLFGFLWLFLGGKGSDGFGDWLCVLVGCAVFGEQCACGATRGWWRDRVAYGDYIFLRFAMRVGLAPAARHIVG